MTKQKRFPVYRILILILIGTVLLTGPVLAQKTSAAITIDCSSAYPWVSQAGFLHGHYVATDDQVRRLNVGYWRDPPVEQFGKLKRLGMEASMGFAYLVKDGKDYKATMVTPANAADYVRYITERYQAIAAGEKKYGYRVKYWEFWNEPEGMYLWEPQSKGQPDVKSERLFFAFKVFHDTIRSLRPDALILAPSSCHFWPEIMADFLRRCAAGKVRLDAVAWHVIDVQPHEVPRQVAFVRDLIRKYPGLGVKAIHLNEFGWPNMGPGSQAAYFYYLGQSRVDLAAKSIWGYEPLDNLVTNEGLPRVSYWLWEFYGRIGPRGFTATSSNPFVVALAGTDRNDGKVVRLIVARSTESRRYPTDPPGAPIPTIPPIARPAEVTVSITGLPDGPKAVEVVSLPNTDYSLSRELREAFTSRTQPMVKDGRLTLPFSRVEEEKVFLVTVRSAAAEATTHE